MCAATRRRLRTSGVTQAAYHVRVTRGFLCVLVKPSVAALVGIPPVVHYRVVGDVNESQTEFTSVLRRIRWS